MRRREDGCGYRGGGNRGGGDGGGGDGGGDEANNAHRKGGGTVSVVPFGVRNCVPTIHVSHSRKLRKDTDEDVNGIPWPPSR